MARVAIVGAGLAGLTLARSLAVAHDVTVFEKSRGPGGRMATRYADAFEFDHGAQFFTARTTAFQTFLEPLIAENIVRPWLARFAEFHGSTVNARRQWSHDYPHYVGVPGMNAIGKRLAEGLLVRSNTKVDGLEFRSGVWSLAGAEEGSAVALGEFDWVFVTAPLAQTADLLAGSANVDEAVAKVAGDRSMLGCFALMLGFGEHIATDFDAALVRDADISWISVNSSKPGRQEPSTLVVHATNRWADAHMDAPLDHVLEHMLGEVSRVTGLDVSAAAHKAVHRWRYANLPKQSGPRCYFDHQAKLGIAGDWFVRGRVEAAFTSAAALLEAFRAATDDEVCANRAGV